MKVGVALNITARSGVPDAETVREHLALATLAESLGYNSVFVTEHHFTDYALTPSPLQLLTYLAGRTERVLLGTAVLVLPWHDPVRLAEEILMLESLSPGRALFGVGRGTAGVEYDGLGVPGEESEVRFVNNLRAVVELLGGAGPLGAPAASLRPKPAHPTSFLMYTASTSGNCGTVAAELGLGQLVSAQASLEVIRSGVHRYREIVEGLGGTSSPPVVLALATSRADPESARRIARRYLDSDWDLVNDHYGYTSRRVSKVSGYEKYRGVEDHFAKLIADQEYREAANAKLIESQVVGSVEECVHKFTRLVEYTGSDHVVLEFCFGGMPLDEVRYGMTHFAREVLPVLRQIFN